VIANIGRDELKAKIDQGDHFVLLEVLGPPDGSDGRFLGLGDRNRQ
jgi:hypothetical protein